MDVDQFTRVVNLAGDYHDEATRCADAKAFHAACLMIGCALEAALLATAVLCERDLREQGRWPENGPDWTSFPIARLRFTAADKSWTLYWRDRNLRFHLYDLLAPSSRVDDLLSEIDRDPTCIFWG